MPSDRHAQSEHISRLLACLTPSGEDRSAQSPPYHPTARLKTAEDLMLEVGRLPPMLVDTLLPAARAKAP